MAFIDLLDPEQRRRQEMQQQQLRPQSRGAPAPQQSPFSQSALPPEQLAKMQPRGNAFGSIMNARSPTAGTALAKALTAGLVKGRADKKEKEYESKLSAAIGKEEAIEEAEITRDVSGRMGDYFPKAFSKRGYGGSGVSETDIAAAELGFEGARDAEIKKIQAEEKRAQDLQNSRLLGEERSQALDETGMSKAETWWNSKTGKTLNFHFLDGKPVDAQGNPISTEGYQDVEPSADELGQWDGEGRPKQLKETDVLKYTEKMYEDLQPLMSVQTSISALDKQLAPYMVGGSKEDAMNIPGVGLIEGSRGTVGDIVRYFQGDEAQQISATMGRLMSAEMREMIGSQQTLIETNNTLRSLSQQNITSEDAAVAAYMQFRESFEKDIRALENKTHPQVLDRFNSRYHERDLDSPFDITFGEINFPGVTRFGEEVPTPATAKGGHAGRVAKQREDKAAKTSLVDLSTMNIDDMTEEQLERYTSGNY